MNFVVYSSILKKALQTIGGVISSSQSRPILENFLFEIAQNQATVTASDGETTMITSFEIKSQDNGKFAVPAKILLDFIKNCEEQPLTLSVKENEQGVANRLTIIDEENDFVIGLDNADEYPQTPDFESENSVEFSGDILLEGLSNTLFATGSDSLRPMMSGVLFQFEENGLNFVATDSHRLVVYTRKDIQTTHPMEFILPKKSLNIFKNILSSISENIRIDFNENMAKFTSNGHTWICRILDGKYPNYRAVIPQETPNILTVNRTLLLNSIKRASAFSNKSTNQIRFKLSANILYLHTEDTEFEHKANMQIPCSYHGDDLNIGFSSKYLSEMLSVINSEDVYFKIATANRAGIIEPADSQSDEEKLMMLSMPVIG